MDRRHRPVFGLVMGVLVGVLIVALVVLIAGNYTLTSKIRDSQVENTRARKSSDAALDAALRTLKAVQSCTTPGKPCNERGKRQTAGAVSDINKVVILAAACSVGLDPHMKIPDRQAVIQSCVIDRLARQR